VTANTFILVSMRNRERERGETGACFGSSKIEIAWSRNQIGKVIRSDIQKGLQKESSQEARAEVG
jgi:hypothetical protein